MSFTSSSPEGINGNDGGSGGLENAASSTVSDRRPEKSQKRMEGRAVGNDKRHAKRRRKNGTAAAPLPSSFAGRTSSATSIHPAELDNLVSWATRQSATFNPLLRLSGEAPFSPSLLEYVYQSGLARVGRQRSQTTRTTSSTTAPQQRQEQENDAEKVWKSLDTSAMVAIGMALEEMVTMALLPLAAKHVARCRRIEDDEAQRQPEQEDEKSGISDEGNDVPREVIRPQDNRKQTAFQDWTLPPEEALLKLFTEEIPSNTARATTATAGWDGGAFGQDEQYVSDNMDLFSLFLPDGVIPRAPP